MTPDERQMISDLFERMRSFGPVDKDREADALIGQLVRQTPDGVYKLVQSVLVQESTLQETGYRVQELEDQIRQLEDQIQQMQAPPPRQSGGSFLGGGRAPAQSSGVPITNRSTGFGQPAPPQLASPWGRSVGQQQPAAPVQPMQQAQAPAAGGGFLRSAMMTAAGVAGGIFAANAIKDMMGGGSSAQAGQSDQTASSEPSPYEVNQGQSDQQGYGYQSDASNDPGNSDEGSSWGGDGGGEVDL